MLTLPEKIIFIVTSIAALVAAGFVVRRIFLVTRRGHGEVVWDRIPGRVVDVLGKAVLLLPVWRTRFWASFFHALVVWGFVLYILVNLGDVLEAFLPGYEFLGSGPVGDGYRLLADVLSVGALIGMVALLIRRQVFQPEALDTRATTLLHPKARAGIRRDSLIVGLFILVHVGSRFLGESFHLAASGGDPWQPLASRVAGLWLGWSAAGLNFAQHAAFWGAIGSIQLFVPYFLISKHIHLIMAPLNFLLQPERSSPGALEGLDFEDQSVEQFGATRLEDLGWSQILDAYACIMCNRCQDACPAYNTGKVLSPAALEINKRYFLNQEGARLAAGQESSQTLLEFAITEEAVWACTACGACTDICPVGNDPMRDIMDIRRSLILMENRFPDALQTAFRGMERTVNPWNVPPTERLAWTEGLEVPTVEQNPDAELLWWVGCAPATDARAQKTARAFVRILHRAGVNFAVLGTQEACTGDSARRAGHEYLFFELASANVELLNELQPQRIVTTCPHCLHTILNEYPAYGGKFEVVHHTQLIKELLAAGQLQLDGDQDQAITFHDPCYLGRQNGILIDPRQVLVQAGGEMREMPRRGAQSFCCGAGGAQMWKEEEEGEKRVSSERMREAVETGADTLAVGCPFCMVMLEDAAKTDQVEIEILDVAEIVSNRLKD